MSILSWCFLPEDNLYLTHDTLQKFTMPISTAIIKKIYILLINMLLSLFNFIYLFVYLFVYLFIFVGGEGG